MKVNNWIRLSVKMMLTTLFALFAMVGWAQKVSVRGVVTAAEDKLPLIGVSVIEKGTTNGTITNPDGEYTIEVSSSKAVLMFSMISYRQTEVAVGNQSVINLEMATDDYLLDEVVVTGYTSEKKADITGAVSVVKMKDIESIPTGNIISALQGRMPGVAVFNDGQPGGTSTSTLIRGITTINPSAPLYIVDGVQTRDNIATLLNSNDVESIQVLKDAASASIYGTKAANGVIIITTKKAGKQRTRINFDTQLSMQTFHTGIKMLNAQQWGDVYWKAYLNDGRQPSHDQYGSGDSPVIPDYIDENNRIPAGNTNWADEVYETALMQNYNLSVTSGGDRSSVMFSFNYFDQDGLIKHTNFQRYNSRLNSTFNFLDNRIRVGENINISNWNEVLKPGGIEELTIAQHPLIPVYDIDGNYGGFTQGLGDKPNPVRLLDQQKDNSLEQWRIFGNLFLEVEPIKNFVVRSSFGLNVRHEFGSSFEPKWSEGYRSVNKNSLYVKAVSDRNWIWSNTAVYNLDVKSHSMSFLAGMESSEATGKWLDAKREDFIIEDENYRYLSAGDGKQTNGGLAHRVAMLSYFGKINYAYDNRYLLSATLRNDASSRFGKNNNSAYFPAFTAGWRISQEAFMKDIDWIDDLKLRGSWGKNGNDELDNEATYTKYSTNLYYAGYDIAAINKGTIPNGIRKDRTGNPSIRWETTTQTNIGLDASLLTNRLVLTVDYFNKKTEDMLIDKPYIAIKGEGGYTAYNAASLEVKGTEFAITWRDKIGKDFHYDLTVTGTANTTKYTHLPEEVYYTWGGGNGIDQSVVGQPLGSWMGYKTDGLYRTEEELEDGINQPGKGLGRIRYVDINGDKVIDDKDRTWLGTDQPKFIGGLNINMSYRNFDCTLFFNGMVRDAWNNAKFYTDFFQLWTGNHGTNLLNAWNKEDNFNSNIPALTAENLNDEGRGSDYFIEDGSYIKLKNLQIGYTLPQQLTEKLKMQNVRFYLQGQDLFTITNYSGADPEGLGYPYPIPRTFTFGLNISL